MKIRQGFVSNSSSSSFVVAFPRPPEDEYDLQGMLFGKQESYPNPYSQTIWPTAFIASLVWRDLTRQEPNDFSRIMQTLVGWFDGRPEFPNTSHLDRAGKRAVWEQYDRETDATRALWFDKFTEGLDEGAVVYTFEYSDENDLGAAMEHGTLFDNLYYKRISNH